MKRNLKIGIIGGGGIARSHVTAYRKLEGIEIVAVADIVPGKAQELIDEQKIVGAKAFEDYNQLLEMDLDGVSICVPNVAHYQTTVDSLKAGKHVLVEKPLAINMKQGIEMVKTAEEEEKILTVGFQPRYDPNMKKMYEIVQSGKLGNIYYVEVSAGRRRGIPGGTFIQSKYAGAGALVDIGTYSLDLALNALNHPKPISVSAITGDNFGKNPKYNSEFSKFDVEDFSVALIRLEGGIVLNFKISWAMHMDNLGPTLFLGDEAGLKITPSSDHEVWGGVWDQGIKSMSLFYDEDHVHKEEKIKLIEESSHIFDEKIADFVYAIQNDKPAPIPAEQILINQAILDGILKSAKLQKEINIDLSNL